MKIPPPVSNEQPITFTSEGIIPAILVTFDNRAYWLVVKTNVWKNVGTTTKSLIKPVRNIKGKLVYAVPGGGSYVVPE